MMSRNEVANLVSWLCYSIVIPIAVILFRGLAQLLSHGPGSLRPLDLLSNSEVAFLAAVIVAETLGQALVSREASNLDHYLIVLRVILLLMLMLSILIAGAVAPLETVGVVNDNSVFLRTPAGYKLLSQINLGLLLCVLVITLLTRLLHLSIVQTFAQGVATLQDGSQEDTASSF